MEDIEHYSIRIYNFPYDVEEDDEDTIEENSELRVSGRRVCVSLEDVSVCVEASYSFLHCSIGSFTLLYYWQ